MRTPAHSALLVCLALGTLVLACDSHGPTSLQISDWRDAPPSPPPRHPATGTDLYLLGVGTSSSGAKFARGIVASPRSAANSETLGVYVGLPVAVGLSYWYAGSFPALHGEVTLDGAPWDSMSVGRATGTGYYEYSYASLRTWTPADSGLHVFQGTLDPENLYEEVDETNNSATLVVHAHFGNAWAFSLEFSRSVTDKWGEHNVPADTVTAGTQVFLSGMTVCNGVLPSLRITLSQGDVVIADKRVSVNATGWYPSFPSIGGTWAAEIPGPHEFTLRVDPDDEYPESDEADNTITSTIFVTP